MSRFAQADLLANSLLCRVTTYGDKAGYRQITIIPPVPPDLVSEIDRGLNASEDHLAPVPVFNPGHKITRSWLPEYISFEASGPMSVEALELYGEAVGHLLIDNGYIVELAHKTPLAVRQYRGKPVDVEPNPYF